MTLSSLGSCQISMINVFAKIFNDFRSFIINAVNERTISRKQKIEKKVYLRTTFVKRNNKQN